MDPFSDLPPATTVPEPISSAPPPLLSANGSHPPYPDMIISAIAALKDKDGSSRQAIAKYIEKEYPNLPSTHSNLLTHHLKLMKNQGQLIMVKHSYMLPNPRSVPYEPSSLPMDNQFSVTSIDSGGFKAENASVPTKRKPGRPPKPRHDFGVQQTEIHHYQPQFEHNLGASGHDVQSNYGAQQEIHGNHGSGGTEPIFASLGLADDGTPPGLPPPENAVVSPKRGRGRPPKVANSGVGGEVGRSSKGGRPKLKSITMVNGGGGGGKRGRPKKIGGPVTVPLSENVVRQRGRPRRAVSSMVGFPANNGGGGGGGGESGGSSRRRGRPPKSGNKARKLSGESFGNLSKDVVVTDPHELVAYQELKLKYEQLQSKAKEVLSVIRPYANSDYAAFGALQELDTLVGDSPSHVESENLQSVV